MLNCICWLEISAVGGVTDGGISDSPSSWSASIICSRLSHSSGSASIERSRSQTLDRMAVSVFGWQTSDGWFSNSPMTSSSEYTSTLSPSGDAVMQYSWSKWISSLQDSSFAGVDPTILPADDAGSPASSADAMHTQLQSESVHPSVTDCDSMTTSSSCCTSDYKSHIHIFIILTIKSNIWQNPYQNVSVIVISVWARHKQ